MADITKCAHTCCRQAMWCYRKRARNSEWQAWDDMFEPHPTDPSIPCLNFWAIEGRRDIESIDHE
jgi:hypothetical protein